LGRSLAPHIAPHLRRVVAVRWDLAQGRQGVAVRGDLPPERQMVAVRWDLAPGKQVEAVRRVQSPRLNWSCAALLCQWS
jgi:hypothetical protein